MEVVLTGPKSRDELLNKYDALSYAAVVNFYTLGKERDVMVLADFDCDNKDHMFFLHNLLIAKDICGRQFKVKCSLWKWFKLNWRIRKSGIRIPRYWKRAVPYDALYINDLAEFMKPLFQELKIPEGTTYGDVYEVYANFYMKGEHPSDDI